MTRDKGKAHYVTKIPLFHILRGKNTEVQKITLHPTQVSSDLFTFP